MTPPARLQPVQAWAIVDPRGRLRWDLGPVFETQALAQEFARDASEYEGPLQVVRVTVRAWAPKGKTSKGVKR